MDVMLGYKLRIRKWVFFTFVQIFFWTCTYKYRLNKQYRSFTLVRFTDSKQHLGEWHTLADDFFRSWNLLLSGPVILSYYKPFSFRLQRSGLSLVQLNVFSVSSLIYVLHCPSSVLWFEYGDVDPKEFRKWTGFRVRYRGKNGTGSGKGKTVQVEGNEYPNVS